MQYFIPKEVFTSRKREVSIRYGKDVTGKKKLTVPRHRKTLSARWSVGSFCSKLEVVYGASQVLHSFHRAGRVAVC